MRPPVLLLVFLLVTGVAHAQQPAPRPAGGKAAAAARAARPAPGTDRAPLWAGRGAVPAVAAAPEAFSRAEEAGNAPSTYRTFEFGGRYAAAEASARLPGGGYVLAGIARAPDLEVNGNSVQEPTGIALLRLQADGTPDPAFGENGRAFTFLPTLEGRYVYRVEAYAVTPLAGGAFLVAGLAQRDDAQVALLLRYRADGTPDPAFGTDGYAVLRVAGAPYTFFDGYNALAVQPDGRIVVAGSVYVDQTSSSDFIAARFTAAGALDPSFGTAGVARVDFDSRDDRPDALAVLPGGEVVLAGRSTDPGTGQVEIALLRLTASGAPDPGFGVGGKVRVASAEGSQQSFGLVARADGSVVVAGYRRVSTAPTYRALLLRVDATGALDAAFGTGNGDGLALEGQLLDLDTDAQGRFYAMSYSNRRVLRFSASGAYDAAYTAAAPAPGSPWLITVAVDGQGQAMAAGLSTNQQGGYGFYATRFTASGSLDAGFGTAGVAQARFWSSGLYPVRVLGDASGRATIVGGVTRYDADFALARFAADGTLDEAFGTSGVALLNAGPGDDAYAATRLPDGRVVVVGQCQPVDYQTPYLCDGTDDHVVARFTADGRLDPTFVPDAAAGRGFYDLADDATSAYFEHVLPLADGGLLLVGSAYGSSDDGLLVRLGAEGTLAASFGQGGRMRQRGGAQTHIDFEEAVELADGRLIVLGELYTGDGDGQRFLARYSASGTLDAAFGQGGLLTLDPFPGCDDEGMFNLRPVGSGFEALVGAECGANEEDLLLAAARYTADGVLDGAMRPYDFSGPELSTLGIYGLDALHWAPDGTLTVVGMRTVRVGFEERQVVSVARLRADGTLDPTFGTGGLVTFSLDGLESDDTEPLGLVAQPGGSYLIVGNQYRYPLTRFGMASYDDEGLLFTARVTASGVVSGAEVGGVPVAVHTVRVLPNPVAGTASVELTAAAAGAARVAVYDLLGREVAELYRGDLAAGPHRLTWDAGALPSGMYVVRLETPTGTAYQTVHTVR